MAEERPVRHDLQRKNSAHSARTIRKTKASYSTDRIVLRMDDTNENRRSKDVIVAGVAAVRQLGSISKSDHPRPTLP